MNPNSDQKRIAFGYKRDSNNRIVLYEGQAAAVKLIYMQYLEGFGLRSIKELLENLGAPSPYNQKEWGLQSLSNILSNPHYIGDDVYPQIITKQQYEFAQCIKATKTY